MQIANGERCRLALPGHIMIMADVYHNPAQNRFEITLDGQLAELTYLRMGDRLVFAHTGVPVEFRGKGIAAALVKAGLEFAERQNLRVVPQCSYVAAYIEKHPQYRHLLATDL